MEDIFDYRRADILDELDQIRLIWDTYYLDFDVCRKQMAFPKGVTHSYVGDIMGNFGDTTDVIYGLRNEERFVSDYAGKMSLMQSIYVQQDFIEELLWIFKCRVDKSKLKEDETYSINREIRNELFGHPIRRINGELISTTLIAYNGQKGCINYMKYHKDNSYEFESVSHNLEEIIERHTKFLRIYLEKVLMRMKRVLRGFKKNIQVLENILNNEKYSFETILNLVAINFENIFKFGELYGKEILLKVYERRETHLRYQQLIESFLTELENSIQGHYENIEDIINPKEREPYIPQPSLSIQEFINNGSITIDKSYEDLKKQKVTYHYELGKLATNPDLFDYCYRVLKEKCSNNKLVQDELDFMKENRFNKIEYFSALNLIRFELKEGTHWD